MGVHLGCCCGDTTQPTSLDSGFGVMAREGAVLNVPEIHAIPCRNTEPSTLSLEPQSLNLKPPTPKIQHLNPRTLWPAAWSPKVPRALDDGGFRILVKASLGPKPPNAHTQNPKHRTPAAKPAEGKSPLGNSKKRP